MPSGPPRKRPPGRPRRPGRPGPRRPVKAARRHSGNASGDAPADASGERLQKFLASAGLGSRRQCEELITAGRVEIDRQVVTELGTRVDSGAQEIRVDGTVLRASRRLYYAVNKPDGVISTNSDPSGRPRVVDLAPKRDERLFCVGRLDLHSEGLILLTNDGELANRLTHPRYGIQKVYRVTVAGSPERDVLDQLRRGIRLAEAFVRVPSVKIKSAHKKSTVLEMVLEEGRNREIRRVLAKIGHKVLRLERVAVGPIRLGTLAPGECRPLARQEVQALRAAVKM